MLDKSVPLNLEKEIFNALRNNKAALHSSDERSKHYLIPHDGKNYFLKVYTSQSELRVEQETLAYQFLAETGILVIPELLFFGRNFLLLEYLQGEVNSTTKEVMYDLANFHFFSKHFLDDLIQRCFETVERDKEDILDYLSANQQTLSSFCNPHKLLIFVKNIPPPEEEFKTLVHGDFCRTHAIKTNKFKRYYIDLELMHRDNLFYDLATFVMYDYEEGKKIIPFYFDRMVTLVGGRKCPTYEKFLKCFLNELAVVVSCSAVRVINSQKKAEIKERVKRKAQQILIDLGGVNP